MNRLWKLFFGKGLAASLEDLGAEGEAPYTSGTARLAGRGVHRERLGRQAHGAADGPLASVSPIVAGNAGAARVAIRRIACSPGNRARGSTGGSDSRQCAGRERATRRAASAGASARPYQPDGYYQLLNFPKRDYTSDKDQQQYRRGVYTHWQRQFLHPDAQGVRRAEPRRVLAPSGPSNTPLAALVLLNDPTFVEAARAFAVRIVARAARRAMDDSAGRGARPCRRDRRIASWQSPASSSSRT